MKKLLTILGTISTLSVTTLNVVACGDANKDKQDTNIKFSDYQNWVKESANQKNISIMFIGGRQNSDTYSYISALYDWVYHETPVLDKTFDDDTVNQPNAAISAVKEQVGSTDPTAYQRVIANDIQTSIITPPIESTSQDNSDNKEWFGFKDADKATSITTNTILVNDITTFWKSSTLGGRIIDDLFTNQFNRYWEFMQEKTGETPNNNADKSSSKIKEQAKKKRRSDFNTMIKASEGPYFLVFRNGKIINMTTGYANYWQYNNDSKIDKALPENNVNSQAGTDLTNLFRYLSGSATTGYGAWANRVYAQFNQGTSDSLWTSNKDKVSGWNSKQRVFNGTNNIPDPNVLKPKTTPDQESTSTTKMNFNLDWSQYTDKKRP